MTVHDHLPPEHLRELAKGDTHSRRNWVRSQAVVLAQAGRASPDIGEALGYKPSRRPEVGRPLQLAMVERIGYGSLVLRPQHKDSDEEVQAIFKEVVRDQIQAIAEAPPGKRAQVFFKDEARFGEQGTMTRL